MAFLSFIAFTFIGICAIVAACRSVKLTIKGINTIFNKLENKFLH